MSVASKTSTVKHGTPRL